MAKKNDRAKMGQGLKALLGNLDDNKLSDQQKREVVKELAGSVAEIPVAQIEVNKYQPREDFDKEALDELAQSIKTYGLIQPITVRRITDNEYELISGERRLRASKEAGLKVIPAYIRIADDQDMLEMSLVENIQREDLNAIEIAQSYERMVQELGLNHDEISDKVGKKRSTVSNYLRLIKLPPTVKKALRNKDITMGHARAILAMDDVDDQLYVYDRVANDGLSVRETEKLIQKLKNQTPTTKPKKQKAKNIEKIEDNLRSVFGIPVDISINNKGKGNLKFVFSTQDELQSLLDLLKNVD